MIKPTSAWTANSLDLVRLLTASAAGDRSAFAALYHRTSSHLFAVIVKINRDRAQAEDILQEIFISIWNSAGTFDETHGQPMTWLTRIARNRAIDSLRRARARPIMISAINDDIDVYALAQSPLTGPLEQACLSSDVRVLCRCIKRLSVPQQQCTTLSFFHGLSHAEIAVHLSKPLGTVKSLTRGALISLKRCIESPNEHARVRDDTPSTHVIISS